jgi:hypothetical protein
VDPRERETNMKNWVNPAQMDENVDGNGSTVGGLLMMHAQLQHEVRQLMVSNRELEERNAGLETEIEKLATYVLLLSKMKEEVATHHE